jgi:Secretion system C-terminal sorting domain
MKSFFTFFSIILSFTLVNGQINQTAITGCKTAAGGLEIIYDWSKNCPASPGKLQGLAKVGFHSGVNTWMNVVSWDAATVVTGTALATGATNNKFKVTIPNLKTYYGIADLPTVVNFVFNQGATVPATPWGSEGKAFEGADCKDFFVTYATLPTCAVATQELRNEVKVVMTPNPMTNQTTLLFNNSVNKAYDVNIFTITGQLVRSIQNVTESSVNIEKGNMAKGMYFVKLTNNEGQFLTEKLIVE